MNLAHSLAWGSSSSLREHLGFRTKGAVDDLGKRHAGEDLRVPAGREASFAIVGRSSGSSSSGRHSRDEWSSNGTGGRRGSSGGGYGRNENWKAGGTENFDRGGRNENWKSSSGGNFDRDSRSENWKASSREGFDRDGRNGNWKASSREGFDRDGRNGNWKASSRESFDRGSRNGIWKASSREGFDRDTRSLDGGGGGRGGARLGLGERDSSQDWRNGRGSSGGGEAYRGRGRGRGRGGSSGRGRTNGERGVGGGRRDRPKKMHPGAYTMLDERTGETVVVWGVEDEDEELPVPTAAELDWKMTTTAIPGETSDETWTKLIEEQSGSFGSFRVKGAEPFKTEWTDTLSDEDDFDGDFGDEDGDEDDDEDEENYSADDTEDVDVQSEGDSGLEEDVPKHAISRAPRVKLFGRDLWGKTQSKAGEERRTSSQERADTSGKSGGSDNSAHVNGSLSSSQGSHVRDLEKTTTGRSTSGANEGKAAEGPPSAEVSFLQGSHVGDLDKTITGRGTSGDSEGIAAEDLPSAKLGTGSSEGSSRSKADRSRSSKGNGPSGSVEKSSSKGWMEVTTGEEIREASAISSGPADPYIIEISDEGSSSSRSPIKHHQDDDASKSDLLERLRVQVAGQRPATQRTADRGQKPPRDESSDIPIGKEESVDASTSRPLRDLTERRNYDASLSDEFFSRKSFKDVGASPEVIRALSYLQVEKPSEIQAMAFKPIFEGKTCIVADQSGSGKTLAYVAPLVQRLRADEEKAGAGAAGKSLSKKPRVLVLVPTGELAAQVLSNFRTLSKGGLPCRSVAMTGGFKWKSQVESLQEGADVVVATPGRLLQHLKAGTIQFDNLRSVVLDEVDILFDDEDFSEALQTVNDAASVKVQYIHVTATLPVDIHDDLLGRYPDSVSLMGPGLHRTSIGLQEVLVDCSGGEADEKTPESAFNNKRIALLQLVQEKPVSKTIVFCNKLETCRKVENILSRHDRSGKRISVLPFHAALSQEVRLQNMETFLKPASSTHLFLVCTDRASRGIDSLDVEHVVLFDFPRDPSEYVRRVGRTARGAGGTGKVFAFVVGKQVSYAKRLMARNEKGEPVHDVPGEKEFYERR